MHDGAGGHRGLAAAGDTFIGEWFGLQTPAAATAASGADKPVRPATLEEVFCARRLRRKTTLELDQRFWKSALRSRHGSDLLKPPNREGVYADVHFSYTTFRWAGRSCISLSERILWIFRFFSLCGKVTVNGLMRSQTHR